MVDPANTEEFLKWVEETEAWYDRQSTKWSLVLSWCRFLALFASLSALAAAAASDAGAAGPLLFLGKAARLSEEIRQGIWLS